MVRTGYDLDGSKQGMEIFERTYLSLAGLVDTGRDGPESYTDVVRRAIRQESWAKTDKGLNLGSGGAQKEVLQPSPL